MTTLTQAQCSRCGRAHDESALVCNLCGQLLRRAQRAPAATASSVASTPTHAERIELALAARVKPPSAAQPWKFLAIGLVTAPIFAFTPILQYMGWFLSSLVHEMGHAAFAWLCGMPAIPAISLAGHAAAVHDEQQPVLVALIGLALAWVPWKFVHGAARWVAIGLVAVLYPALALTGAKELLHLLAGHGGELAFATLCLWKTLDGGFTRTPLERGLYGTVGWYLLGKNALLCFGLMTSGAARARYESNGSFGLTNDMIRAAEDVLGWPLQSVALLMLVVCALVLPAALVLWRVGLRVRASGDE